MTGQNQDYTQSSGSQYQITDYNVFWQFFGRQMALISYK